MAHKVMPTTYFTVLLVLSMGAHHFFPIMTVVRSPLNYAGIVLVALGVFLNLWTDALFKKTSTTVKPHLDPSTFISFGPFGFTRHPMYLGMALSLLGLAVFTGSLVAFISPVVFVVLMEALFIPFEEENMERIFGSEYTEYKRRVRRWI